MRLKNRSKVHTGLIIGHYQMDSTNPSNIQASEAKVFKGERLNESKENVEMNALETVQK